LAHFKVLDEEQFCLPKRFKLERGKVWNSWQILDQPQTQGPFDLWRKEVKPFLVWHGAYPTWCGWVLCGL